MTRRIPYPWLDETGTPFYTHLQSAAGQAQLLDHYTLLLNTRNAHPALRTGSLDVLLADDGAQTFAYGRKLADQGDAAVVFVSRSNSAQLVELDVAGYLPVGAQFSDVLGGGSHGVGSSGQLSVNVPANGGALLVLDGALAAAPAGVDDLIVTSQGSQPVQLSWSAAAGADSYDVYRSLLSGGGYVLVGNTSATSFSDTGLQNSVTYYYVVVSRDDTTLLVSEHSNEVSGTPQHDLSAAWFNLQWPPTLEHEISTTNRTQLIFGQIWIDGATGPSGPADGIRAQVGRGSNSPDATWQWEEMSFNIAVDNNDEYMGSLLPDQTGTFNYATRWSADGGDSWFISDLTGPGWNGNPGVLTVKPE